LSTVDLPARTGMYCDPRPATSCCCATLVTSGFWISVTVLLYPFLSQLDLHRRCPSLAHETFTLTRLGQSIDAPETLYRSCAPISTCFSILCRKPDSRLKVQNAPVGLFMSLSSVLSLPLSLCVLAARCTSPSPPTLLMYLTEPLKI